jgi:hypothetical protein
MFKQFGWVEQDGIYDHREYCVRYHIIDGTVKFVMSKMWLESPPSDLKLEYRAIWGTYPDVPPKPPKKGN